jgi:hypothetical protein
MKVEEMKEEVAECKLHMKIFLWPRAWTFPRTRRGNCVWALEEEN